MNSATTLMLTSLIVFNPIAGLSATDHELLSTLEQLYEPTVMVESTLTLSGASITLRDCQLYFDEGEFVPFTPITLDSMAVRYGGCFTGSGRFLFNPPLAMERQQINRFFNVDTLNRTFEKVIILCNDTVFRQLLFGATSKSPAASSQSKQWKDDLLNVLKTYKSRYFFFQALQNFISGDNAPFLTATLALKGGTSVVLQCDPLESEEMGLFRKEWLPGPGHFLQTICSYSLLADPLVGRYNGADKGGLAERNYDIDATVLGDGKFTGVVKGSFSVDSIPTRLSFLDLSEEMKIDSILDSSGQSILFRQYKDDDDYLGAWLIFSRWLDVGEIVPLTFYYSGDVAERNLGVFYVFAGSSWYPSTGRQRARFHLRFRTRSDYQFLCTGDLLKSTVIKDTLITEWEVAKPTHYVSFNIGLLKKYEFAKRENTAVDVYFSEDLHSAMSSSLALSMVGSGRHMERQVSDDIFGSLSIFSQLFGQYPHERLVASEVIQSKSTAYPGAAHLGVFTWISTDRWGYDRLHRSHEVAHQWWGAGVGFESYRDQWLSEGFAEYSSFMYLQAVAGNDQFMDRLDEIRKEVLAERKTAGAIALGYRASNYKEPDHYSVLIYEKGALVLHMLRNLLVDLTTMKEDRFVALMRDFYTTYVDKDPTTADFQRLVEKYAGVDMSWFFDQWVYGSAIPTYDFSYTVGPNIETGNFKADLHIEQTDVPEDFKMYVPLEIEYESGQKQYVRLIVDQPVFDMPLGLPLKPKKLRLNPFLSVLADVKQ